MGFDDTLIYEEGLRGLFSEMLNRYDQQLSRLDRIIEDLEKTCDSAEELSRLYEHLETSIQSLPNVAQLLKDVLETVNRLASKATSVDIESLDDLEGLVSDLQRDLPVLNSKLEEAKKLLRDPLRLNIVAKCHEYLGLNEEDVRHALGELDDEQISSLQEVLRTFTNDMDTLYQSFKPYIKEVFSANKMGITGEVLIELPSTALRVCKLLSDCERLYRVLCVKLVAELLCRVNNYDSLINKNLRPISDSAGMLVGLLPSICKSYGFDTNTLYSSIMDRIGTKLYATPEDVKNDLDRLVERARLLNRLREEHKKLRGILDEARKEYERVKDQLSRDRRQAFEGYLKSLEEFDESYSRELPSDVASVVGHMFEYSWSPRCPSDITHELYKKISGSIDGLVKLLEDIKSIAERLSYGQDLVDRVERLLGELKSGNEGQILTKYHEYLTSSDSILGDLIHNIQAEYEREGVIEVDLTEQTAGVISALVGVFRGYGMRVTLRCVRA